jgi:hypothetical protein
VARGRYSYSRLGTENPLAHVAYRVVSGAQQQSRYAISGGAVDLLRHGPVVRAQTGLDMSDRAAQLKRQRAGEHGVSVVIDQYSVGLFRLYQRVDALKHSARHCTLTEHGDVHVVVRTRNAELFAENLRHIGV